MLGVAKLRLNAAKPHLAPSFRSVEVKIVATKISGRKILKIQHKAAGKAKSRNKSKVRDDSKLSKAKVVRFVIDSWL